LPLKGVTATMGPLRRATPFSSQSFSAVEVNSFVATARAPLRFSAVPSRTWPERLDAIVLVPRTLTYSEGYGPGSSRLTFSARACAVKRFPAVSVPFPVIVAPSVRATRLSRYQVPVWVLGVGCWALGVAVRLPLSPPWERGLGGEGRSLLGTYFND